MLFLLKCGHSIRVPRNYTGCARCSRCGENVVVRQLKNVYDGLENRYAKSTVTNKIVKSRWDLNMFCYKPNEDFDSYR